MATSRLHHHPSLPAPVVHAGFSVSQSKSHVLAGVQDAYWSDDEAEDAECPLCLEEMDISDLNFKPCICGYQICRFCWHHIKENLNKRCPACRRVYTDDAVEFKPIATQDHKRLTQQKKQRERERKELDALGRRALANVRVVQRNVVYVVGIGPRFAKEELIPTLRSNEYFGQYGKINKILLVKRTPSGGGAPVVGLYITYHRREDAARCITAVDGTASPGGGRELMRASYGTTKYCMSFLRGVSCSDHGCMNLHEWGDEKDCFTKEDLTTLKHTMKATESRSRNNAVAHRKGDEQDGALPRGAAWAQKINVQQSTTSSSAITATRQTRRGGVVRQARTVTGGAANTASAPSRAYTQERRIASGTMPSSQASSSRPVTPAPSSAPQRPNSPTDVKALQKQERTQVQLPPSPSIPPDPEEVSVSQAQSTVPPDMQHEFTDAAQSPVLSTLPTPSGFFAAPPGLSAPPGIRPARPPRVQTASPQTPLLASQSSYQMSTAARALLDDVKARRESAFSATTGFSPFPDFDRTLQTLSREDGGGFSFNLDPALAGEDIDQLLPDFEVEANTPFHGSYVDAFPALRPFGPAPTAFMPPPGLPFPQPSSRSIYDPLAIRPLPISALQKQPSGGSPSYMGSFDPFAEASEVSRAEASSAHQQSPLDDDPSRKVSRFGFARGRQAATSTPSPFPVSSQLINTNTSSVSHSFGSSVDGISGAFPPTSWPTRDRPDYGFRPSSMQHPPSESVYSQHQAISQALDTGVSEAQLRDLIQSSREKVNTSAMQQNCLTEQALSQLPTGRPSFNDPAIMSARFVPTPSEASYGSVPHGPPPGLPYPHGPSNILRPEDAADNARVAMNDRGSTHGSTLVPSFSPSDFPALVSSPGDPIPRSRDDLPITEGIRQLTDSLGKPDRKAARKVLDRTAERQKPTHERTTPKSTDRMKTMQSKEAGKDKVAASVNGQAKLAKEQPTVDRTTKDNVTVPNAVNDQSIQFQKDQPARIDKQKSMQSKKPPSKQSENKQVEVPFSTAKSSVRQFIPKSVSSSEPAPQVPLLSKKPKKTKLTAKPVKVSKEDMSYPSEASIPLPVPAPDASPLPTDSSSNNSRSHSLDRNTPTSVEELLEDLDILNPELDLPNHSFFDIHKLNPAATMPLEYGPLVHALSALSVGGGSFANNMPSGSIDNAVSSFQQLLETLTQTISDLLRLLPRTTWDDSSSFDGVLRDMLKGDDFLDDAVDEGHGKEDEVAALTLALERRARWMEVQLSKLEELHRDINTAAVRAVLSFNDNGWDQHAFLPRIGNTLRRFDAINVLEEDSVVRPLTADELQQKLDVAKEAAVFAEAEVREVMERVQSIKPSDGI